MTTAIKKYLSKIGRRGGRVSRRKLDSETARKMVRIREAKRSYKEFYTQCFWSCDPDYKITADDIQWVAEQLMKNGGLKAWKKGSKLCR